MVQIRKLSPELAQLANREFGENETRLKAGVHRLKEWMLLQPHIKEYLDDQWLAAFLRGCKFSLDCAQEKLEKFYTARTLVPELFKNRDPTISPIKDLIQSGYILPLKNETDPTGPIFSLVRVGYDASKFSLIDFFKYSLLVFDIRIYQEDNLTVSGFINICDLKDVTLKHLTSFTPTLAKKFIKIFTEAYPIRLKGINFLNPPTGFETAFNLFTMFMPAKMKSRVHIHQNIETLYEYVPKENLPKEYGGEAGTFEELTGKWATAITNKRDFLLDSEKYCSEEKLRIGDTNPENMCSVM